MAYPTQGTSEWYLVKLKKLAGWLEKNPSNNPLVAEEYEAVMWAISELEKNND